MAGLVDAQRKRLRAWSRFALIPLLLMGVLGVGTSLHAQNKSGGEKRTTRKFDWSDLEENKYKLYGSEKEAKFPVSLWPFIEIEDWDKYYSLGLFSLYKYTRYPRFNSITILPLYHHLESKVDDRERFWLFPLVYQKLDGDYSRTVTPLTWKEKHGDEVFRSYFYFFYANETRRRRDWGLLPLWYTGARKDNSSSYDLLLPLFYRGSTNEKTLSDFTLVTPGLFLFLEDNRRKSGKRIRSNFSLSPLHFYNSRSTSTTTADNNAPEQTKTERDYSWGVPIIPVLAYRSKKGDVVRQNIMTVLLDAAWRKEQLERFWLTPILYFERGTEDYLHVLPPLFMSFGKRDGPHYQHFLPIYYEWSDNEQETILTLPIFYNNTIRRGKKENYYHEDTVISPFHYAHTVERGETNPRRDKDILYLSVFQALPIYYSNIERGQGAHRNVLGLIDWSYHANNSLKRSMVLPIYYYGRSASPEQPRKTPEEPPAGEPPAGEKKIAAGEDPSGALHIFPLLSFNWWEGGVTRNLFFPIYYRSRNTKSGAALNYVTPLYIQARDNSGTTGLFGGLYYYNHKIREGGDEYTNFLFPLVYRNTDARDKTSFTYATPLYFRSRSPDTDAGLISLLWYYSRDYAVDSNLNSLIPFYLYSRTGSETSFYSWLYYHNSTSYLSGRERSDLLPFIYYNSSRMDDAQGKVKRRDFTFWLSALPIYLPNLPLLYLSRDAGGSHVNLLTVFDWRTDAKGGLRRFWSPFLFYGREAYTHIPLLAWFSWHGSELYEERSYLAPLFYHNNSNLDWSTLAGPLWLHSDREDTFNLHVLPFFYSWKTRTGKTNLLPPLYYYASNRTQSRPGSSRRETLLFSPLGYYSNSTVRRDEYFKRRSSLHLPVIPLLYYGSEESDVGSTRTLLTLIHWKNDKENELSRFWTLPLLYYGRDKYFHLIPLFFRPGGYDDEKGWSFSPLLYYHSWSRDHDRLFAGIYYTHSDSKNNTDLAILFPTYWAWDYPTSKGQLILPFVYEYEDKQKYVNINALGLSRTRNVGKVGFGKTQTGRWYLDTDISWLYNMVSVSARVSVPSPFGDDKKTGKGEAPRVKEDPGRTADAKNAPNLEFFRQLDVKQVGEKQLQKLDKTKSPHLTRKNNIVRSESEYFWGMSIAYGWLAYEIADTKRHFRMFPFAWFSWDTRSDDRVNTIPFLYLSYQSEELSYFALFPGFLPLYGRQREGKSFVEVYGALWPVFIREYDDDEKRNEYSVFWPFYNQHSSPTSGGFRVIPLVWHKTNREAGKEGRVLSSRTLSPVYYQSFYRTRGPRDEQAPAGTPVRIGEEQPGVKPDGKKTPAPIRGPVLETAVRRLFILPFAPLWYRHDATETVFPEGTPAGTRTAPESKTRTIWSYLFPVYVYRARETAKTAKEQPGTRFTLVGLPLLYYDVLTNNAPTAQENIPTADTPSPEKKKQEQRTTNFFLLGYYSHNSPAESSASFLLGLFRRHVHRKEQYTKTSFLYGLISSVSEADGGGAWALPFYYSDLRASRARKNVVIREKTRVAPILLTFYFSQDEELKDRRRRESSFYSPLWFHFNQSTEQRVGKDKAKEAGYKWDTSLPLLLFMTMGARKNHGDTRSEKYFNWLYLFQWESSSDSRGYASNFIFSPLLWYSSSSRPARRVKSSRSKSGFRDIPEYKRTSWLLPIPGLYRKSTPSLLNYNLLFFADWEYRKRDDRTEWYVFPLLFYESGENGHFTMFPFFWNYRNSYRKSRALHIAPLYFSWRRPDYSTYLILGLYLHFSPNRSRQNFFYLFDHNSEPKAKRDTWSALFGSAYMRFTPRRNKYRLLYGLLFALDYNKETKTNPSSYDYNFLWMRRISNKSETHFSFIPFWWYDSNRRDSSLLVLPPLLSFVNHEKLSNGKSDNTYFLAGLYWRTNPNYRRRNFLFLADYTGEPKYNRSTWNFLFGTVHLKNTDDRTRFALFYRLLAGVNYKNGRDYDFNLAWYIQYRDRDEFHSSFIPVWYYNTSKSGSTLVIPPLLTYADRDASGVFQMVGLGSVWYRNYDSYSQRDRRSIALGILYGDVRKPKNGYRSLHSLWGFLWEYQRETETGWSKFTILKLPIYKRVQRGGKVRTYIMGVRTD